jgi:hypothetical protein
VSPYNPEKCVRVPTDARLWIASLYLAAFVLLVTDTVRNDPSMLSRWGIFLTLIATAWTVAALHAYSRQVILEVMSWEHRQQGMLHDDDQLSVVGR